jgi:hypothetical protein
VAKGDSKALEQALALRTEIRERDEEVRKEFADVEKMIRERELPEEILQRHLDFVAEYDRRLQKVEAGLRSVEEGTPEPEGFLARAWQNTMAFFGGDPIREEAAAKTSILVESFERKPRRSIGNPKPDEPRRLLPAKTPDTSSVSTGPWQSAAISKSRRSDSLSRELATLLVRDAQAQANDLPGSDSLKETLEVEFTPGVVALSEALNGSPSRIYNWVYNNIRFSPVWGSVQGADGCLQTRICNAFDTASLLIALLRVSGIPSVYVLGDALLPAAPFKEWLGGFDSPEDAAGFLAGAGTPNVVRRVDANGVTEAVRFGHVWVRAYVDYERSFGSTGATGNAWIDLDASFKRVNVFEPARLSQFVPASDGQTIIDAVLATGKQDSLGGLAGLDFAAGLAQLEPDEASAVEYLVREFSGLSLGEAIRGHSLKPSQLPLLPSSLPFTTLPGSSTATEILPEWRHGFSISLRSDADIQTLFFSESLPAMGDGRVNLVFEPATSADVQYLSEVFTSGGPDELIDRINAPLVNVVPRLFIDGVEVGSGSVFGLGEELELEVSFSAPTLNTAAVTNTVRAGESYSIGINRQRIAESTMRSIAGRLSNFAASLSTLDPEQIDLQDAQFAFLDAMSLGWMIESDFTSEVAAGATRVAWTRFPSFAAAFSRLVVTESLFGIPTVVSATGFAMDIDRDIIVSSSLDGSASPAVHHAISTGFAGSSLEAALPRFYAIPEIEDEYWISTTVFDDAALDLGVFSYTLSASTNASAADLDGLDSIARQKISDAIAAGQVVSVSNATLQDVQSSTFSSYSAIDLNTGSGAYIIEGLGGSITASCFPRSEPGDPVEEEKKLLKSLQDAGLDKAKSFLTTKLLDRTPDGAKAGISKMNEIVNTALSVATTFSKLKDTIETAQDVDNPIAGLVVLFAGLELLKDFTSLGAGAEFVGAYLDLSKKVAQRLVAQILGRIAEIDLAIAGIQLPPGCLARGVSL